MRTLLIGGARSGKSSLATRWAAERSDHVCCLVTATASDGEMAARIDSHRRQRPPHWRVREEPLRLATALREEAATGDLLLVDCLTLWTANCLWPPVSVTPPAHADMEGWLAERDAFLAELSTTANEVLVVTNEVGTSLVPENAAARLFRDEQGRLNQLTAAACDTVYLVSAGLALRLK